MAAGLYFGAAQIKNVYLGATKAKKVYLGSQQIWSAGGTITATVPTSADDGYVISGTKTTTDGPTLAFAGGVGFVRFGNVAVPQGATIVSASVTLPFASTPAAINCSIDGIANDNVSTPSTAVAVTASTGTAHTVTWSVTPSGSTPTSPDISAVLQEIVNRSGWASGNAVMIRFTGAGSQGSGASIDKAETLTVTYS